MDQPESRRSYHRGRSLAFAVAAGTALIFLQDGIFHFQWGENHNGVASRLMDWLLPVLICWWCFRGGRVSTWCVCIIYGISFLCFAAAAVYLVLNVFLPGASIHGLTGWRDAATFFLGGIWVTFAFWVLLISKDVRLYREARRLAIRADEADAFAWPPVRHRQG